MYGIGEEPVNVFPGTPVSPLGWDECIGDELCLCFIGSYLCIVVSDGVIIVIVISLGVIFSLLAFFVLLLSLLLSLSSRMHTTQSIHPFL